MKKNLLFVISFSLFIVFASSCATVKYTYREPTYEGKTEEWTVLREFSLATALEEKILALDPEHITEKDIKEILSHAPAPRIINVHGGIYPVHLAMESFSKFLISMGYPEEKIRNPKNGSYSHSCYESSEKLAGLIAWYYEKEGMRPMIVGHSQGGIQTIKILHELAGTFSKKIRVWNPLTEKAEDRYSIIDPLAGAERPVVGLRASYATAVGAGGFTRVLPNQWIMTGKLRSIPDSVVDFTGFYMGLDLIGGDLMGFGSVNKYEPNGTANVRNVKLPVGYNHVIVPVTKHLAKSQEIRDWINNYIPTGEPELTVEFESSSTNILWAADVWHSIKKHWSLEVQRLIRTKRNMGKWQLTN
jgi:hypothetical protein